MSQNNPAIAHHYLYVKVLHYLLQHTLEIETLEYSLDYVVKGNPHFHLGL